MPVRTRIKYCGLRSAADIQSAVAMGVDALGFVLWGKSRRSVDVETLAELVQHVPPFVTRVGLFVDASEEEVSNAAPYLDLIQYHGNESPEECARIGKPWIKALRMRESVDLHSEAKRYHNAQGLLLDAYHPDMPGGTGQKFDWERVPHDLPIPVILAGGLTSENVAAAIECVHPYAVDVSGGIEEAPGVKSEARMKEFAEAVQAADKRDTSVL